ncbi:MAG: PAS domain S-box protein, partial [Polynucleobacter sp.]|nr:PAS domain S-box protein [Polynucleobacter sp.]
MPISWDFSLVLLSVAIAIVGSLTSLAHAQRMRTSSGRAARVWMLVGGTTLGLTIWSMHFIGMLAFELPIRITYNLSLTLLSALPAIIAAMLGFHALRLPDISRSRIVVSSLTMGAGISTMHYTGMAAIDMTPPISYNSLSVAASFVVATIASLGALLMMYRGERISMPEVPRFTLGGVIMGLAISGMHYTAMLGTEIMPGSVCRSDGSGIEPHIPAIMVSLVALYWFGVGSIAALFDRRMAQQNAQALAQLEEAHRQLQAHTERRHRSMSQSLRIAAIAFETQEAIMITDCNSKILRVNQAFSTITGYASDEIVGRTPNVLSSGRHDAAFFTRMHAALRDADYWSGEIWDKRKNGEIYPKWLTISAVRDEAGGVSHYVAAFVDISEHLKDLQHLAESERFTRATLDALTARIAVLDSSGCITQTNRAWREFAEQNDLPADRTGEGVNYLSVCDGAAAEGVAEAARAAQMIRKMIADGHAEGSFEYPCHSPQQKRWFLFRATRFMADGQPNVVVSHTDITARKLAEETLKQSNELLEDRVTERTEDLQLAYAALASKEEEIRSVVENMVDCIISIDETGIIQSANPAIETVLGYRVDEVIGRNVSMLMPEPHRAAHDGYLENFRRTGEARIIGIGAEVEGLHKDGTHIAMELSISEYVVGGKRFFTGILRDVRDRQRIMKALEQARHEAEQASHAKSAFLAAMSHEIRTPMNGVIGMVDVLHQTSLKGYQVEIVDTIRDSAYSLLGIIEDILDFSKIEAGRMEVERESMSVAAVVEQVCKMLDHEATKKGVEFTLFIDPAIPAKVLGDALRLRQVLVNLANNAIKFSSGASRQGKVALRACLVGQDAEQLAVEFEVNDNGIGMDALTQARLFNSFSQADVTTTRRFGGSGLGLAIVKNLLQLMGGEISVRSTPGIGSSFLARLPLSKLPDVANADEAASPVAGLCCRLVGGSGTLSGDLAVYLSHGGANVERTPDLAAARESGPSGLSVWVIDAGDDPMPESELHAAASRPDQDVRFVLIGRGHRREPRTVAPGLVVVDGNGLERGTFLYAVASAAGKSLPEKVARPLSNKSEAALKPPSRTEAIQQGRLILVAEDNETNQKVILRQLALLGYAADVAGDGREALKQWESGDHALILTDLHMPEMDGYELCLEVRASETSQRHIPIIALTANALRGEAKRCLAVGMDAYLSKPTPLAELQAMLDRWLPATRAALDPAAVSPTPTFATLDVEVLAKLVGSNPAVIRDFLQSFRTSASAVG